MDYKKVFGKFGNANVFVKTTVPPGITSAQKVALNRKGNMLFNSGDVEGARRIFETTGYSDGLSRVGDHYKSQNRFVDALRMYWIAPDRVKCEPLFIKIAEIMRSLIREDESHDYK
ncbi:MAG: hypothetical protein FWD88_04195 [Treponema sp.]|nr:hypothetical protein [Treponema sp.]